MTSTPDTTAAFDAEADHTSREERVAKLRAELAEMEAATDPVEGEIVTEGTVAEVDEPREITIGDDTWHYHPPTEGQVTIFAMAANRSRALDTQTQLRRIYGFLANVFTDDSLQELMDRVEDRNTEFSFNDLMEVVSRIIEATAQGEPRNRAERRAANRR